MKKLFILVGLSFLARLVWTQTNQEVLTELENYVKQTCHYLGDCPFAIVVSKNGKILHESYNKGAGALGEVNAQSRWQLFSITKSFISALALTLVEKKMISLDDPVSKYLPAFKTKGQGAYDRNQVTIRHLMSHTSGTAVKGIKLPTIFPSDLNEVEIVTQPGKDFLYSGLGMNLLERTLEAATGKNLDALLQEYVIKPLGLQSASYVYANAESRSPVLPIHPNNYSFSQKGSRAGSGLFINARDLNTFGQFWFAPEKLFSQALKKQAWTWHGTRDQDGGNYGLLWWLFEDQGAYVMSGHQYKVNAVIPSKGVVITVLRLPQNDAVFEFWPDKFKIVSLGNKLK